ncbi:hypothetical protein E3E11_03285 [Oecophyllibacter saccharovorans]|uniref:hypothetical protein n=1 Tax=Oecophyllibacter saccharovorans TaxID=2558360 RepID=UPI0011411460|nr:hypothetical protein [Oecophyllibacter saccharovorans]QDH15051.1 hypothetical protein E3E11_03285 [Oecophyllibacter saccharovorans]
MNSAMQGSKPRFSRVALGYLGPLVASAVWLAAGQGRAAGNAPPVPPYRPGDKCFSVARTQAGETPPMPILVNQCTGETWLLVYSDMRQRPYWVRIEFGRYEPVPGSPAAPPPVPLNAGRMTAGRPGAAMGMKGRRNQPRVPTADQLNAGQLRSNADENSAPPSPRTGSSEGR